MDEHVNGVAVPQAPVQTAPVVVQGPLIPWWEWAAVGVVGLMLGGTARMIGARGAMGGALLYLLGYWVRNRRPAGGYNLPIPSPLQALISGERQFIPPSVAHVIDAPPQG